MKSQKIIFAALTAVFLTFAVQAQKFSIEEGYVQQRQAKSAFGGSYPQYFHGERIGVNAEFNLKYNFSLLAGVLYSVVYGTDTQWLDAADSIYNGTVLDRTFSHSLDVPLRVNYSIQLPKDIRIFAFAGPNVNIGLGARRDRTASISPSRNKYLKDTFGQSYNTGIDDLYKNALIHRINFQLGVGGGIQWKNLQLKAGYDFGINNLSRIDINKLHTNTWWVSFAYQF